MAINTGSHPKHLWPGIKTFSGLDYAKIQKAWKQVFDDDTSNKAWEEYVEDNGITLLPTKPEGSSVSYFATKQGYVTRLTNTTYAGGVKITQEAIEDDQYESAAMRCVKALSFAMFQTEETVHANVLNRAFTAAYAGGDGKELLATDHPTADGTQSNELAVAADLSEASLEDILTQASNATDSVGNRVRILGQKLIIPTALQWEATRILSSVNQSGTANNDINALRATGMLPGGIVTWAFLDDPDAWFVKTDVSDGLIHLTRRGYSVDQDNDFDTSNACIKASARWAQGWHDFRGLYGSAGA